MTPASSSLARHFTVGYSTGFMREHSHDWARLIDASAALASFAVELSAREGSALASLVGFLRNAPRLPFLFVSVHAPSTDIVADEAQRVEALCRIPAWIDTIVVDPDTISDARLYRRLGRRLALENMDARKPSGRTAEDLRELFGVLPDARLCLDLAHAKDVDGSLVVAIELLRRFGARLSHVHVSSLDASHGHVPLTEADSVLFDPLLRRCRDVPWILEAPPPW